MGRVKLKLKRLENNTCRQTTFSKRKNGLIKKASELSILCDIDIVLLMFSPSGKPTLFKGQNSIEDIILKFAQLTPQERAKRKLESLEALKRTFKKLDHDVNLEEFFGPSYQSVEDLTDRVNFYRTQLSEVQNRLSYWTNLDKIEGMQHLGQMEDSLKQSISQIRAHKENLVKQQELAIQCANQFENGMHLPYDLGMEQQFQPSSWIQNDHSQNITLSTDLNLLSQRDSECSGVTSFGNCSNFFGVSEKLEMSKIGHENSSLGELCTNESLSLQMSEQQQQPSCYPSYGFGSLSGKTFQQNIHENALNFCLDANFEFPQSGYEFSHQGWAASGPEGHAIQSFDENFFPQQQHYSSDNRLASGVDNMYLQSAHHSGFAN